MTKIEARKCLKTHLKPLKPLTIRVREVDDDFLEFHVVYKAFDGLPLLKRIGKVMRLVTGKGQA